MTASTRLALLLLGLCWPALVTAQPRPARVATIADGPWEGATLVRALVARELSELAGARIEVTFPPELQRDGAWSVASVTAALDDLLATPDVDVIITLDALGSHIAGRRATLAHPVVAAAIIDAGIQRLPARGQGSGRSDLTYVADDIDVARDLAAYRKVVEFEHMALLAGGAYLQAIPELARSSSGRVRRKASR